MKIASAIALYVIAADQALKWWILRVSHDEAWFSEVIPGVFAFGNRLARPGSLSPYLFLAFGLVALSAAVVLWNRKILPAGFGSAVAFALLLGGIISTVGDLLIHGRIVDTISVSFSGNGGYFGFSIADASINAGVMFAALLWLQRERLQSRTTRSEPVLS